MSNNSGKSITTICIIRHGQSTWNAERRIQGQMDPPLSPLGKKQAGLVAKRVENEPWDALYSSDLSRASQTAEAISQCTGLKVNKDPLLREIYQGKVEGLLAKEAREKYPDFDVPEVGRETADELRERAVKAFWKVIDSNVGKRVIIVSHGGLIRSFLNTILESVADLHIINTSCTMLHWDGENWECDYLADASHLESLKENN
ncbi:MAG: histidine phosphatase family protein [Clostridiales bacterium]|nr:histidine phosphatase family protein [Clostridiales bacterium]